MSNIAIFASGSGTNAQKIIDYFSTEKGGKVTLVLTNRADAYVLKRAESNSIDSIIFDRHDFYDSSVVVDHLVKYKIDFIVLAGFLWLVPDTIIDRYPGKIVNIHPALLPSYGGKGMFGDRVHKAVIEAGERESGITIHYVNSKYDDGDIIFQARCSVMKDDTSDSLARRIHDLEHRHYPEVIANLLKG
jgi:phosphoribosylglycinamide formyltransferase-1